MKNRLFLFFGLVLALSLVLAACSAPAVTPTVAPTTPPTTTPSTTPTIAPTLTPTEAPTATNVPNAATAALKISGMVDAPQSWTEVEVKAMPTMQAQSTNKQGQTSTYTGVSLKSLLDLARPSSGATTLVFVAEDGFTAELPLADALACEMCIVSFRDQGGFSTVMPGMAGNLQVKGVIEIQVK